MSFEVPCAAVVAAPSTNDLEDRDALRTEDPLASGGESQHEVRCHFCGRPCGPFTRFGFLEALVRSRRRRRLGLDA